MVKAIVFDIGNILLYENRNKLYKELSIKFNYDLEKFKEIREKYINLTSRGEIDEKEYLNSIAIEIGISNIEDYYNSWMKICEDNSAVNTELLDLIKTLKEMGYVLASFTNITPLHNKIREKFDIYSHFDINLLSYKEKFRKPEIQFYQLLISKLNLKPEEILYIDDSENFLVPANQLGIKTLLFKNNIQLLKDLQEMEVLKL